jgi:DNA polymerase III epsilon subunit-like protein
MGSCARLDAGCFGPHGARWPEFLAIVDTAPVIAHHAAFDMNAFRYTLAASNIDVEVFRFACSRVIARDTWPGWWSYSLPIVVDELHLPNFEHHDPLDDAMACARIVQLAIVHRKTNSLEDLIAARHFKWGRVDESLYQPFSGLGFCPTDVPAAISGRSFRSTPSTLRTNRSIYGRVGLHDQIKSGATGC